MKHPWVQQYRSIPCDKPNVGERGGATIEMTLLTPLLLLFLLFVVLAGRSVSTKLDVQAAAADAARAASMKRNPAAARSAAVTTASVSTAPGTKACRSLTVLTNTDAFRAGGSVSVDVECVMDVSDLSLLRISGTRRIHGHAIEAVDTYRAITSGFTQTEASESTN